MLIDNPSSLIRVFPLYFKYYVIQGPEPDKDMWVFKEKLHNGYYPKYTLTGKTLDGEFSHRASLFATFFCLKEEVSVLIEDIVVSKRKRHVGSWMVNQLLCFLKTAGTVVKIVRVYGHFINSEDRMFKENFFRRFGFDIETRQDGRSTISSTPEDLHMIALPDIKEISIGDIIKDWNYLRKKGI